MQSTLGDTQAAHTASDDADSGTPESSAVDSLMHALMSIGRLMRHRAAGDELDPRTFWLLKTLHARDPMRVTDLARSANL